MVDPLVLAQAFPNLPGAYRITSRPSPVPNCIGWALHDKNQFWTPEASRIRGYYWPPGVAREWTLESVSEIFRLHQYVECESAEHDPDSEKIAIYADASGEPQHVARQLSTGAWTSKLGTEDDIEHDSLEALAGGDFGSVVKVMRRPRKG